MPLKRSTLFWRDLTPDQKKQAERQGTFIGYSVSELKDLQFRVEKGKVVSIRDNRLLTNVFNVKGRRPKLRRERF